MEFNNQTYLFKCSDCARESNKLSDFKPQHLYHGFWCKGDVYRQRYLVEGSPVKVEG